MSKTPSSKLYDLIHALSGSEKRYFKLFVQKKGTEKDSKYNILFNAIEQQDTFDDEVIKKIVYGNTPIQSRKYSELKSYLYDLILKALQSYDEKTSVHYRIQNMLQSVRVLFKRGHFEDCLHYISKLKKLAYKYELFSAILDAIVWEKQIAYTLMNVDFLEHQLPQLEAEEMVCLSEIRKISMLRNVFLKLYTLLKKAAYISREEIKVELQNLMSIPVLQDKNALQTYTAKTIYLRIYSLHAYALGQYEEFYAYSKKLLQWMESNAYLLKEDVSEFISIISNHCVSCIRTMRYDEWEQTLNKLLEIKPLTYDDELKIHRQYYQGKFAWCIRTGAYNQGMHELEAHLELVQQFDQKLFARSSFYFQYFQIYFGNEDYDMALEYLNQWLNQPKSLERQDLQILARILNLIVHFEMNNIILLNSLIRSTYRFLKKTDYLRPVEKVVLSFIKNSTVVIGKQAKQELLQQVQEELNHLPEGKVGPFDYISWLESKILQKTFAQVVKQKFEDNK